MQPRTSTLCLEVRLSSGTGDPTEFQTADGEVWRYEPEQVPQNASAMDVWNEIAANWRDRHEILNRTGSVLGQWLFGERVVDYLRRRISAWRDSDPRLRIELRVPRNLAEYPWEMANLDGSHLAVHPALTVVRVSDRGDQPLPVHVGQVRVHVIGVADPVADAAIARDIAEQVEVIREEIENVSKGSFYVEVFHGGDWQVLVDRYRAVRPGRSEPLGPPHVFHFTGHGLPHGQGLVFRKGNGEPNRVFADQVASLLSEHPKTRLAFLSACSTSTPGHDSLQPFGGLASLLIEHNIPMVVGFQSPVRAIEAKALAATFYAAVGRGDSVDCGLQEARRELFLRVSSSVGWAFLNLSVSGEPRPLCAAHHRTIPPNVDDLLLSFGHENQRQRLSRFLSRKAPMVIVVHGDERSGHRHVLKRLQVDLERAGNVLWRPVAELSLNLAGDPLLTRSQLTGGIARALSLPDDGAQEDLEDRIAEAIGERTCESRVLVIDLVEELKLRNKDQAHSLLTLTQELWSSLMRGAAEYRSELRVFLLVSVAYPRPLPDNHKNAKKIREITALTSETLSELAAKKRLPGEVQVELLARLEPFDEQYVAEFLEDTLNLKPDRASSIAANLVDLNDNETILERLKNFLIDLEVS